ncbi:Uncharacterised protein [Mycobacteroides abscessus subsp. massiliense]|nr:Uncharacterised protein [Mycobacteroides abscessus subsp. massiliense]
MRGSLRTLRRVRTGCRQAHGSVTIEASKITVLLRKSPSVTAMAAILIRSEPSTWRYTSKATDLCSMACQLSIARTSGSVSCCCIHATLSTCSPRMAVRCSTAAVTASAARATGSGSRSLFCFMRWTSRVPIRSMNPVAQ